MVPGSRAQPVSGSNPGLSGSPSGAPPPLPGGHPAQLADLALLGASARLSGPLLSQSCIRACQRLRERRQCARECPPAPARSREHLPPPRGHPPFCHGSLPGNHIAFRPPGQACFALIGGEIPISFRRTSSLSASKFFPNFFENCLRHQLASQGHGPVCADTGLRQVGARA